MLNYLDLEELLVLAEGHEHNDRLLVGSNIDLLRGGDVETSKLGGEVL